jgi:hypothetical protein
MQERFYNITGQVYTFDQYLKVDARTNSVIVINRGDGVVRVNGVPLAPSPLGPGFAGESVAFSGNAGEYFRGMLEIVFDPANTDPRVCVLQKYYIDQD